MIVEKYKYKFVFALVGVNAIDILFSKKPPKISLYAESLTDAVNDLIQFCKVNGFGNDAQSHYGIAEVIQECHYVNDYD